MQFSFLNVLSENYFLSAVEGENENTSEHWEANENSARSGSPKGTQHFEDGDNVQEVAYTSSKQGDDSYSRAIEDTFECETEEAKENVDGDSGSASTESTPCLEDIADMETLPHPISSEGFREFLDWKSLKRQWDHLLQNKNRHDEPNASDDEDMWLP
jgi:hypothetical protein